jgi:hypothetical protein
LFFVFFVYCMACFCSLSLLYIVSPVFVHGQERQRTNTGHTIYKKEKGQKQAIQ